MAQKQMKLSFFGVTKTPGKKIVFGKTKKTEDPPKPVETKIVKMDIDSDEEVAVARKRKRSPKGDTASKKPRFGNKMKVEEKESVVLPIFSSDMSKREKALAERMKMFQLGAATPANSQGKLADPSSLVLGGETKFKTVHGEKHKNDVRGEDWYVNPRDFSGKKKGESGYDPTQWRVPKSRIKKFSPGHQVWWGTKSKHADSVLFFKIGKFYEIFWMDADLAHEVCGVQWMASDHVPHVGFPEASFDKYVEMLVREGHKVVRVEQMETPAEAKARGNKKGVRREVCQIVSPGTLTNPDMLGPDEASYLLCVVEKEGARRYGVAFVDCSTAHFYVGEFSDDRCRSKFRTLLAQIAPKEVVYLDDGISAETVNAIKIDLSSKTLIKKVLAHEWWEATTVKSRLEKSKYFEGGFPEVVSKIGLLPMEALGGITLHLRKSLLDKELLGQKRFYDYNPDDPSNSQYLVLDGPTLQNLEILVNEQGTTEGTLLKFVDHTRTVFGKRKMRTWIQRPLTNKDEITARLDAVDNLRNIGHVVDDISETLKGLPDMERLLSNVFGNGAGRKMDEATMFSNVLNRRKVEQYLKVLEGFEAIGDMLMVFDNNRDQIVSAKINYLTKKGSGCPDFNQVLQTFTGAFDQDRAKADGEIIPKPGTSEIFDQLLEQMSAVEKEMEGQLKLARSHFKDQTIRHKTQRNKFTNALEIKKKSLKGYKVPQNWKEVHDTKSTKVFLTAEQEKWNEDFEVLEEQIQDQVKNYAKEQFIAFSKHRDTWDKIVECMSELDCLLSLHYTSAYAPFEMCRPKFVPETDGKSHMKMIDSKHPCAGASVVAQGVGASEFIANDIVLGCDKNPANFVIVTGPNMGGKSTLLRQTCINVILAQMGCYVAARECELTVVDRIFTRIGANDRILNGQSTFFVELEETSSILRNSTERSLVILDELGRGTSTFDGTAIAFAVAKYLAHEIKCRTLFSTHYHLLPKSFANDPTINMYHMTFMLNEETDDVTFLYKFEQGICHNSHGINCAKMAGLPTHIVSRAQQLSQDFEKEMASLHTTPGGGSEVAV